jgi:NADP-dependent 3-hydroxy acid dehydrogenase YdfG
MKTAIVTGVTLGVGNDLVALLLDSGYKVIGTSRQPDKAMSLQKYPNHENLVIEELNYHNRRTIEEFLRKYNDVKIDLLVNNAAGANSPSELNEETMDNFNKSYELNVSGPMYLTKMMRDALSKSDNPTVIFISSFAGKYPYPGGGNYCNSKRALSGLVEQFRIEFAQRDIKVTEICPSTINTSQTEQKPIAISSIDVANAVAWVASMPRGCNINIVEMAPTYTLR